MTIVCTCGDINGIGPEIAIKASQKYLRKFPKDQIILIIPGNVFHRIAGAINFDFPFSISVKADGIKPGSKGLTIFDIGKRKLSLGKVTPESGRTALQALEASKQLLLRNLLTGIVTAPISKEAISLAGSKFAGHTEMLASWFHTKEYAMVFHSDKMTASPLTIHTPLRAISSALNRQMILSKLNVIKKFLKQDLNLTAPRCALLGLNPHSGENGLLGKEEIEIFKPIIAQNEKFLCGPFAADAFFGMKLYRKYDCVVGCYHDQVLIPFKMLSMREGVNVTAGLPFVRTSPDHGTGYDIADTHAADATSMYQAILLANRIIHNRMNHK